MKRIVFAILTLTVLLAAGRMEAGATTAPTVVGSVALDPADCQLEALPVAKFAILAKKKQPNPELGACKEKCQREFEAAAQGCSGAAFWTDLMKEKCHRQARGDNNVCLQDCEVRYPPI